MVFWQTLVTELVEMEPAGGPTKLASACGVSRQAVHNWLSAGMKPYAVHRESLLRITHERRGKLKKAALLRLLDAALDDLA
jgi:hypothetical protein